MWGKLYASSSSSESTSSKSELLFSFWYRAPEARSGAASAPDDSRKLLASCDAAGELLSNERARIHVVSDSDPKSPDQRDFGIHGSKMR